MNWTALLASELQRLAPEQICALDTLALETVARLMPDAAVRLCRADAQLQTPANAAVVMAALHGLDAAHSSALLAHVRNFVAPCILVVANEHSALDRLGFLSMGFDALGSDEAAKCAIYRYELAHYKQIPDWLNARYWAHPERWKP